MNATNIDVLILIKTLDPTISNRLSEEQLFMYIAMAEVMVDSSLAEEKRNLGIALITLDMISIPEVANLGSSQIGDVRISYYKGAYKSKWKTMYESLLEGMLVSDLSLLYVGI